MNWGYKILIVYGAFVIAILFMVFKSSQQNFDLVTDDYYAKELKFQQQIDAVNHTNALSAKVQSEIKDGQLLIHFPKDFEGKKIEGKIHLYYAADKTKDIITDFTAETNAAALSLPASSKGMHELHLEWSANGVKYYLEEKIFL